MTIRDFILKAVPRWVLDKLNGSSERSKEAVRNIVLSLCTKCVTVLVSLLLVPITISYVNPSQYGIWMTLSSVIGWIAFFDLGLGNGFRNRFTEAKARGDMALARQYVSTTYFALAVVVSILFAVALAVNHFTDWTSVLKVDPSFRDELRMVFSIVCLFFCISMCANVFTTMLTADQKPGIASVVNALGQICSLAVIFALTKCSEGSLLNLALYYSGVPCMVVTVSSLVAFRFTPYRQFSPRLRDVRPGLIKDILSLGAQFFVIYICLIAIFQVMNIIISRELGPEAVTQYNIASRYFNVMYMLMTIVITPFWSAFTEAYSKQDFAWMKSARTTLERLSLLSVAGLLVMLVISPWFYRLWIGAKVEIPLLLSTAVMVMTILQIASNLYMHLINGIGAVRIQLIVYVILAFMSWPGIVFSCRALGVAGVVVFPSVAYLAQAVVGRIQIDRIIENKASGIWMK